MLRGAAVDIKYRPPRRAPVGGKWTEEEDRRLREIVETFGAKNWKRLAMLLGSVRSDVQCLHRWNKVLRPGLSKGPWTAEEDRVVREMVLRHGAGNIKWSVIAAQLPGRWLELPPRERPFALLVPSGAPLALPTKSGSAHKWDLTDVFESSPALWEEAEALGLLYAPGPVDSGVPLWCPCPLLAEHLPEIDRNSEVSIALLHRTPEGRHTSSCHRFGQRTLC